MSASQRVFFALWPDEARRSGIVSVSREAVAASGGRAMLAVNLHATLVFLGEVPAERLELVEIAAQTVRGQAFELQLDCIDTWREAQMLVLGTRAVPQGLADLVSSLRRNLSDAGFAVERRPFRFHVTLARKAARDQRLELQAPVHWPVEDFVLVRSELKASGSEYIVLRRWALAGSSNSERAGV